MQTAPTNWETYFADITHTTEYQIIISDADGTSPATYGMEVVKSAVVESALLGSDLWIGNCIARKLTISMRNSVTVPRMAKVVINARLTLGNGSTDYMPLGTWWVDERYKSALWTNLICYDAMLKTEQPFIDANLESGEWPLTMSEAVSEVCTRTGITLDDRSTILTGVDYVVPYTNDLTMREVLGNIATAHGGNWTITPAGKLRLVVLSGASVTPVVELAQNAKSFFAGDLIAISKVTLYDDADNSFSAGDTSGYELSVDCPYATNNIAAALCNTTNGSLYGVTYMPFEAGTAYITPLFELGDDISVNGISSVIYTADIKLTTKLSVDISCPAEMEVDHEYPYLTTIKRQSKRNVNLESKYYGTTISRKSGLTIERMQSGEVAARAIFNSDKLSMQAMENGSMVDKVYFDPVEGNYVFDGKLSADAISAIVVDTPNLYAGKANISELTVDQLDTSDKVQKFLSENTDDDNFQRIYDQYHEFVTAHTDGLVENKVQATSRNGEELFWTDETHTTATADETDYPVWTYQYNEIVKARIGFMFDTAANQYVPMIELGAGTGVGDNGKGFIYKGVSGLYFDYYNYYGELRRIILGEDGIVLTPYALESLSFYNNGFSAMYSGETVSYTWEKDGSGRITKLISEEYTEIPVEWNAGDM